MGLVELGCCGAYCQTCQGYLSGNCRGCKIGYDSQERDIRRARCEIKRCCMGKQLVSCADCPAWNSCLLVDVFYQKKARESKSYRESIRFIREFGYARFFVIADGWKNPYGKLK